MSDVMRSPLAGNLRRLRREQGLSSVELARRAAVSRATLTQLEAGGGNPTLDTIYGLANALDVALADLITGPFTPEPPRIVRAGSGTRVTGDAVQAWLLDSVRGTSVTEIYEIRLNTSAEQRSDPHPRGTREHLHLYSGRMRVGPVDQAADLSAGDFVAFDAATEHLYQRIGKIEPRGLLVITRSD